MNEFILNLIYLGWFANLLGFILLIAMLYSFYKNPITNNKWKAYTKQDNGLKSTLQFIFELIFPFAIFFRFIMYLITLNVCSTYSKSKQMEELLKLDTKFKLYKN